MPDEQKLINAIDAYAAQSHGAYDEGGELSRQRGLALDFYAGKNMEPAPEGRSQVVDRSIFETVQWIMPSIMRIFAGDSNVVEFDPEGPEDEDGAAQESDYLNHLVTQGESWDLTVRTWAQDALITKNAYCMAFMEEKIVPEKETYLEQTEDQLTLLLQDDVEVIGQSSKPDPDAKPFLLDPTTGERIDPEDQETTVGAMAIYQASGQEPQFDQPQLYDVVLKRVKTDKKLKFKVLPPERCRVGADTTDFTLEDCNYFEYYDQETISDLRKMGFDVDDDISSDGGRHSTLTTIEDTARDDIFRNDTDVDIPDPSMKRVIVRNIWIRYDYDEDGIAELQKVILVGDKVLAREDASIIPVACIVPFINTHRHIGEGIADLVYDIQRIKTTILRTGLDSLYLSTNPRHVVSENINLDDLLVSRPGGVVRAMNGARPGDGEVMPLITENVFPQAQEGLRHMDSVIEARVGVNRIFQGIDEGTLNQHDRVGQLSTMAAQRVEDIARLFSSGFKRLFRIAHEIIIKSGHKAQTVKLRGDWVEIDPTQWRTGRDMKVVAPFAAGNKDAMLDRLMLHKQIHAEALSQGLPIVTPEDSYELALMIAEASDVTGTKIYTDPQDIPPPPEQPDHTMIALEIEKEKVENQAEDNERDTELSKYKADLAAQTEKYRVDLNAQVQVAIAELKEGGRINLERTKADIRDAPIIKNNAELEGTKQAVEVLAKVVEESAAKADAPKEFIRDESGKLMGVKSNGKLQKIVRDEQGKAVGTE